MKRTVLAALTACALIVGCSKSEKPARTGDLRLFITPKAKMAAAGAALEGELVWPAAKSLGPMELAHLADPLIDGRPAWGAYSGVLQSSENDGDLQTHLMVTLTSRESVAPFVSFCRSVGCSDGVVFIYDPSDNLHHPRLGDIVGVYEEMTPTNSPAAAKVGSDGR